MTTHQIGVILDGITDADFDAKYYELAKKPKKLNKQLKKIFSKMTQAQIEQGIKQHGSPDNFVGAILSFLTLKALMIDRGVKVGLASGVVATLVFGTGDICREVAMATGAVAFSDIAEGMDLVGNLTMGVSEIGFEVAQEGMDFFSELILGALSLFSS